MFQRGKTAQNSKTEGGIEWKKHENVKLKPRAILLREKPEECKSVCYRSSTSTVAFWSKTYILVSIAGDVLPLVFYKMQDQGSSWSYLCTKAQKKLHVLSYFKVDCSTCPPNNPINARALSLGLRLSLFSEVSYCNRMYILFTGRYIHSYFIGSSPQGFSESMLQ